MARKGQLRSILEDLTSLAPRMKGWVEVCVVGRNQDSHMGLLVSRFQIKGMEYCLFVLLAKSSQWIYFGLAESSAVVSKGNSKFDIAFRYEVSSMRSYNLEPLVLLLRFHSRGVRRGIWYFLYEYLRESESLLRDLNVFKLVLQQILVDEE